MVGPAVGTVLAADKFAGIDCEISSLADFPVRKARRLLLPIGFGTDFGELIRVSSSEDCLPFSGRLIGSFDSVTEMSRTRFGLNRVHYSSLS